MRNSLAEKFAQVTRVSAGCDGEIMRDVIRTFQKQRFFQRGQPGQRMLLHILFGLAATRPDVGYCQVRAACVDYSVHFRHVFNRLVGSLAAITPLCMSLTPQHAHSQGMNYVVASLLLGRIPEQYTDIDHLTPVVAAVEVEGDEGACTHDVSTLQIVPSYNCPTPSLFLPPQLNTFTTLLLHIKPQRRSHRMFLRILRIRTARTAPEASKWPPAWSGPWSLTTPPCQVSTCFFF